MNTTSEVQICGRCRQELPLDNYSPSYRGKRGTWCRMCFSAFHRGENTSCPLPPKICSHCHVSYIPILQGWRSKNFCSRDCKDLAKNEKYRADLLISKPQDRKCLHCGKSMSAAMRMDAKFCSDECNFASRNLMRKHAFRTQSPKRSRATFRALIAERDEWVCGICNKSVDPNTKHPDPMYGSIDHIVPIAIGGSSDDENLQLAHLVCNLRKGAAISPSENT